MINIENYIEIEKLYENYIEEEKTTDKKQSEKLYSEIENLYSKLDESQKGEFDNIINSISNINYNEKNLLL